MTDTGTNGADNVAGRAIAALIGGAAGLALWLFAEVLPEAIDNMRLLLLLAALVMGTFAILMVLTGPVRAGRALIGALTVSVPAALLLVWASLRFDEVKDFFEAAHGFLAYGIILFVGTPFAVAALQMAGGWRDYPRLFDTAWTIVVRYAAGWLFVGLFWVMLMLSDQLLRLVGIGLIHRMIEIEPVPYVLSGLVLGLALGVVHELRDYVSPYLIHRLLRLLLPMLLPVVALFVLALPLRGLGGLFGQLSAASVLMGVAAAGITLISTALDRGDDEAAESPVMVWSVRVFALTLPVLAALAVFAIGQRVGQYGWTPGRMLAGVAGMFVLAYWLAYAVAVLRGGAQWMGRIRAANLWLAVAAVAVAVLWLTPVLNAERIAAQSQLSRAMAAMDKPGDMALWEMAHRWGRPGAEALTALEEAARSQAADDVVTAIGRARASATRYAYQRQEGEEDATALRAALAALLPVRPGGTALPEGAFEGLNAQTVRRWHKACEERLPDGRPGCVAVFGDFRPGMAATNGYVLLNRPGRTVQVTGIVLRDGRLTVFGNARAADNLTSAVPLQPQLREADIASVLDGDFAIEPVEIRALRIGEVGIIPDN